MTGYRIVNIRISIKTHLKGETWEAVRWPFLNEIDRYWKSFYHSIISVSESFTPANPALGDATFAWQPCYPILEFSRLRPAALRPTLSVWFAFFRLLYSASIRSRNYLLLITSFFLKPLINLWLFYRWNVRKAQWSVSYPIGETFHTVWIDGVNSKRAKASSELTYFSCWPMLSLVFVFHRVY